MNTLRYRHTDLIDVDETSKIEFNLYDEFENWYSLGYLANYYRYLVLYLSHRFNNKMKKAIDLLHSIVGDRIVKEWYFEYLNIQDNIELEYIANNQSIKGIKLTIRPRIIELYNLTNDVFDSLHIHDVPGNYDEFSKIPNNLKKLLINKTEEIIETLITQGVPNHSIKLSNFIYLNIKLTLVLPITFIRYPKATRNHYIIFFT